MAETSPKSTIPRPPVIVIMGHIDHGKSTLLDYIRKTNVAETEAGGITQHLSAYEVVHKDEKGIDRKITFLDTPGHEAFQKMRLRGAEIADIAVLIVSAEDGVKEQTLEAFASIKEAGLPYIVAINKIDKPNANVERTKQDLLEREIYLEGLGGDIPWVAISAKEGTGISDLLDMMLLVADLEELTGDSAVPASGVIIEAHLDPRKGISTTLIIKNGTLTKGMCVGSGASYSPVRILQDFKGKDIAEASFSSPIRVVGWNTLPNVGDTFSSYDSKKEAESAAANKGKESSGANEQTPDEVDDRIVIPLLIKADVAGSLDAIEHELSKIPQEKVHIKIIQKGVGAISENDVRVASGAEGALIVGFNTSVDRTSQDLAERQGLQIQTFDIIYNLSEWLLETIEEKTPASEEQEVVGRAKILKTFSRTKSKQVVGGSVEEGVLNVKKPFRIMRQDTEIGRGTITNLQQQKANVKEAPQGSEFGAELNSPIELIQGDIIESYASEKK